MFLYVVTCMVLNVHIQNSSKIKLATRGVFKQEGGEGLKKVYLKCNVILFVQVFV
jgi:hypothetical protein